MRAMPPDDPAEGRPWRFPLLVALGSAVAAILVLLPTFASGVPGDPLADVAMRLWGYWWVIGSLEATGRYPLFVPILNYPVGGSLFVLDPVHCFLAWPLEKALGLGGAYNAIVVIMTVLGCLGGWFLGWEVSRDRWAALVSAVIYGFSPWYLTYAVGSAQSEVQNTGWIAFFTVTLLWTMRRRELRYPLFLALSCYLATLGSFYFGLFCALVALVVVAGCFFVGEGPGVSLFRRADSGLPAVTWPGTLRVFAAAVLSGLLLFPVAKAFLGTLEAPDTLYAKEFGAERAIWTEFWSTHYYLEVSPPADFVLPGKDRARTGEVVDRLTHTSYLGLTALALALAGCLRRGPGRFWTAAAAFFAVLATGPYWGAWNRWDLQHQFLEQAPAATVNPLYWALYEALPFFSLIGIPHRLVVPAQLCLAAAAAWGVRTVVGERWRPAASVALVGIVLTEVLVLSPTPYPVPATSTTVPEVYAAFAADPERYGLLELPFHRRDFDLVPAERFLYQTQHGKGIPMMMSGTFSPWLERNDAARYLFELEDGWFRDPRPEGIPPAPPREVLAAGLRALGEGGYRYAVLQPSEYEPAVLARVREVLAARLERAPELDRDGYEVYRFPDWTPEGAARDRAKPEPRA